MTEPIDPGRHFIESVTGLSAEPVDDGFNPYRAAEEIDKYIEPYTGLEYKPNDQQSKLPMAWLRVDPRVVAWVAGHGHDPDTECTPQNGCFVSYIEVDDLSAILAEHQRDVIRELSNEAHGRATEATAEDPSWRGVHRWLSGLLG